MLFDIYKAYWSREVKGKYLQGEEDEKATHDSLACLMKFLRDFEVIPDTLTAKQGFLIWYVLTQYNDDQLLHDQSVMEESSIQGKVQMTYDIGIFWKLSHFALYIHKAAILSYDMKILEQEENSTKKLLYFLRKLEWSYGF